MNSTQREADFRLLAAIDSDPELKAEATQYGDWYYFLAQHLK
jgi:hypothetical protein